MVLRFLESARLCQVRSYPKSSFEKHVDVMVFYCFPPDDGAVVFNRPAPLDMCWPHGAQQAVCCKESAGNRGGA